MTPAQWSADNLALAAAWRKRHKQWGMNRMSDKADEIAREIGTALAAEYWGISDRWRAERSQLARISSVRIAAALRSWTSDRYAQEREPE